MNRTLRGVWSRRTTLSALFLTTTVVIAGLVTTTGMAEHAGTSRMVAGALFLLGLVAVPVAGSLLASARREEVGVTRLRGQYGDDLVRHLSAEPALAIAGGAVVGYVLGLGGVWLTTTWWLDEPHVWPGVPATVACVVVVVVSLVAAMLGMARVIREPLSQQVAIAERPRATTTLGVFGAVMTLVAAVVVAYRSQVTAGDPDGVVLLGPALLGLAAGQVAVWLLRFVSRVGAARTSGSALPSYLAFRRLRGTGGLSASVRLLTAALVIGVVAVSGARDVSEWSEETTTFDTLGGYRIPVELSSVQTLMLTRRLDPDGQWLMAAGYDLGRYDVGRRAFVDASRFDRVVGGGLTGTAAERLADVVDDLPSGGFVAPEPAGTLKVTVQGAPQDRDDRTWPYGVAVTVEFMRDTGAKGNASVNLPVPPPGESASAKIAVPACKPGCTPTRVTVAGGGFRSPDDFVIAQLQRGLRYFNPRRYFDFQPVLVSEVTLGSDLVALPWRPEGKASQRGLVASEAGFGYQPGSNGTIHSVVRADRGGPLNVVRAGNLDDPDQVETLGGVDRRARSIGQYDALPLVQGAGLLGDLPSSLAADQVAVPTAELFVIARSDTPQDLLDQVVAKSAAASPDPDQVPVVESRASVQAQVNRSSGALQAHSYALLAGASLLVALVALGSAVAAQRRAYAREVASLRVVGVSIHDQRKAGRIELALLGGTSLLVGLLGGLLATWLLLPGLPILHTSVTSVPFDPAAAPGAIALLLAAAAAFFALLGGRGRRVDVEGSTPAVLREEQG